MITLIERQTPLTGGVVAPVDMARHLILRQFVPRDPARLPWFRHVWCVEWDLPEGVMHRQRTLPYPGFNLVADQARGTALFGSMRAPFDYPLTGQGRVVGLRLRPAGQGALWPDEAVALTDQARAVAQLGVPELAEVLTDLVMTSPTTGGAEQAVGLLARAVGEMPTQLHRLSNLVDHVQDNPDLFRVADLVTQSGIGLRSLQDQFRRFVGLSPKTVINRARLHDVLAALRDSSRPDFADLALRLGYYDQAHFIASFRKQIGLTPLAYWQGEQDEGGAG